MDPTSATVLLSALSTTGSPAPLRRFGATENLGALALVASTVVALVWANSPWSASYEALWTTELGVRLGVGELARSLRDWVNEGLMAVFFFVAGLEIRREFDMGELRERRRLTAPVLAALGGMLVPAGLYLAITAGTDWTGGWGVVVGTDTAFALGVLALTRGTSPRVRTFLLTLVVIDDAIALTVIGKALGIVAVTWLTTRRALGALPLMVTWPSLVGVGALAGIGFTVSLLIADISFAGDELEEAKIGILAASALAAGLGWAVFRVIGALPSHLRAAGADRLAPAIVDLTEPVEPDVDHVLGALDAEVTLVWYGDFQCPHCRAAGEAVRELQARLGSDLAVVYRHLPLNDIHPHAHAAAEAAEAAAAQGQFWPMWAALYENQHDLRDERLIALADAIGLDVDRFTADLRTRRHALRITRDISSADDSGAAGTPTLFVNGRRYTGHIEADALVRAAHDVALMPTGRNDA